MTRTTPIAAALITLTAGAAAPALASAPVTVRPAPTFLLLGNGQAGVQFRVDRLLARRDGRVLAQVRVAGRRVHDIDLSGRRGGDVLYGGTTSGQGLVVGRRYTVSITLAGGRPVRRTAVLHGVSWRR